MPPLTRTELHPKSWTALIPLALGLFVIFAAGKAKTPFLYFVGGFCVIASLLLFWFLRQMKLILDDHGITMQTKISTREFLWKDITSTHVSSSFNGKRRIYYWNFETAEGKKLSFALSQYSRKDLKTIADAVIAKCPQAQKDAQVMAMSF